MNQLIKFIMAALAIVLLLLIFGSALLIIVPIVVIFGLLAMIFVRRPRARVVRVDYGRRPAPQAESGDDDTPAATAVIDVAAIEVEAEAVPEQADTE